MSDYKGIEGSKVRSFFATQDYEVYALFNNKDEVINIQSDFAKSSVSVNIHEIRQLIEKSGETDFTDFHNHPTSKYGVQMFSPQDVKGYVDFATGGKVTEKKYKKRYFNLQFSTTDTTIQKINTYKVQTQCGSKFKLKYTGNKTSARTKTENFTTAYGKEFRAISSRYTAEQTTIHMIKWTERNAPKYGFEFSSSYVPVK